MSEPAWLGPAAFRFVRDARGVRDGASAPAPVDLPEMPRSDADDFEPKYLGWEIARCARGLTPAEQRGIAGLAAACVAAIRAGSTRVPIDHESLAGVLAGVGALDALAAARSIALRVQSGEGGPISQVIGRSGDRKPLIVEGKWLYTERMRALEDRFCARIRERMARSECAGTSRSINRAVAAAAAGPPPLTSEQTHAVRKALGARFALITGGPGTGKTTIVVALLRALAWLGTSMDSVAIAAPTGRAARRLQEALAAGFARTSSDRVELGFAAAPPTPQTLHRLLGWSPSSGRFARHENDRLPHRAVIVDEGSMIDLALMDRLMRALGDDARLVLLGDANQLPSVEAGAVFRDLCAGLGAVGLTENLRVARDPSARRIVGAAKAVNSGVVGGALAEAITVRRVQDVLLEGVEHVAARWSDVGDALLARLWETRVAADRGFVRRASRIYRQRKGCFDRDDAVDLRALLDLHARSRLLCVTRMPGMPTSADAINAQILSRRTSGLGPSRYGWRRALESAPGTPVIVERNDYERRLYNGDQGVVVMVDPGDGGGPRPMAVFVRGDGFDGFALASMPHLSPAFAMTVHKAQGSEFDDVALVLPDEDLPLLTRELVYTAITRARRSVLVVGDPELLARAVARVVQRHSGVADRLAHR